MRTTDFKDTKDRAKVKSELKCIRFVFFFKLHDLLVRHRITTADPEKAGATVKVAYPLCFPVRPTPCPVREEESLTRAAHPPYLVDGRARVRWGAQGSHGVPMIGTQRWGSGAGARPQG